MVLERQFFTDADRYPIDREIIDAVALPVGDNYEDSLFSGYFADYAGMARKFGPKRILEVGVRYGYIAIAMCLGIKARLGRPQVEYRGIDDESYHAGSCAKANENFRQVVPWADALAIKWNSFDGLPPGIGTFDFIHIDGNHDYHGVWNDLTNCWPVLNPGGFILLDDATTPGIKSAIETFLAGLDGGSETVHWQWQMNERNHIYIHKVAK